MQPKLLQNDDLAWSPVVANNSMNRERKAIGANSYEKDIYFNPIDFLLERQVTSIVRWLDLCCGKGNALIQTAEFLDKKGVLNEFDLEGIDLVNFFAPSKNYSNLKFSVQNLENWIPQKEYDLITIVHGLHYLGDKINLIQKAISSLTPNGLFIGNMDLDNIKIQGIKQSKKYVLEFLNDNDIEYDSRKKIISSTGKKEIKSDYIYLGADDKAGANYTGQATVDSYYVTKVMQ